MAKDLGPYHRRLGGVLATARRDRGLTQAAVAAVLGVTRTSVTNMERGKQPVPVQRLATWCRFVGLSADVLLAVGGTPVVEGSNLSTTVDFGEVYAGSRGCA